MRKEPGETEFSDIEVCLFLIEIDEHQFGLVPNP